MYFDELLSEAIHSSRLNLANILKEQILLDDFLKDKDQVERSQIIQDKLFEVDLDSIRHLDLTGNNLTEIPKFVFNIPKLTTLLLKRNKITNISSEIKILRRLELIDLSENLFSNFPLSLLGLSNLKSLNLHKNQITQLPEEIDELFNLEHFSIFANNLKNLPKSLLNIDNLKEFDFYSNDIKMVFDTPIEKIPAEIYNQGITGINAYLSSIKGKNVENSYETKLIIIGNSGVGKTTLIRNLLNETYGTITHESTQGIDISEWLIKGEELGLSKNTTFKLNIWDFGGQGIYRELQQFFCSQNTFYIYVTSYDEKENIDKYSTDSYWLSSIRSLSYNPIKNHFSPIIYVVNKSDQASTYKKQVNANLLKEFSESIIDVKEVSCKKGEGINELKEAIFKNINKINIKNAPLADIINYDWYNLKNHILQLKKQYKPILTKKEYEVLYRTHGLEKPEAETLLKFMHQTGSIVYFESNSELKWLILLETKVLLKVTHKLYFNLPSKNRNGIVTIDDLEELIYDENMEWDRLLYFLKWFNVIYEIEEKSGKYLIPPLLTSDAIIIPEDLEKNDKIVVIKYSFTPFIPASLFYKILTKNFELIDTSNISSTTIIFSYEGNKVILEEDWKQNAIILKGISTSSCLGFMLQIQYSIYQCFNTICKTKNIKKYEMHGMENLKQLIRLNQTIPLDQIERIQSKLVGKQDPHSLLTIAEANILLGKLSKGLLNQVITELLMKWENVEIIKIFSQEYQELSHNRNILFVITEDAYNARINALTYILIETINKYSEKR